MACLVWVCKLTHHLKKCHVSNKKLANNLKKILTFLWIRSFNRISLFYSLVGFFFCTETFFNAALLPRMNSSLHHLASAIIKYLDWAGILIAKFQFPAASQLQITQNLPHYSIHHCLQLFHCVTHSLFMCRVKALLSAYYFLSVRRRNRVKCLKKFNSLFSTSLINKNVLLQ